MFVLSPNPFSKACRRSGSPRTTTCPGSAASSGSSFSSGRRGSLACGLKVELCVRSPRTDLWLVPAPLGPRALAGPDRDAARRAHGTALDAAKRWQNFVTSFKILVKVGLFSAAPAPNFESRIFWFQLFLLWQP